jgi:pimeloyl-ACP methyl ester carboxylesterase
MMKYYLLTFNLVTIPFLVKNSFMQIKRLKTNISDFLYVFILFFKRTISSQRILTERRNRGIKRDTPGTSINCPFLKSFALSIMTDYYNFLLIHGAFQGSFVWERLKSKLESSGHYVCAPDLCGITLSEHLNQIYELVLRENKQFIVIGHSYGGLVITGVAQKVNSNIRALIYLDAPIPANASGDSQSLIDILGYEAAEAFIQRTSNGFVDPFPPEAFGLNSKIHSDIIRLHSRQSIKCFTEPCPSWKYSSFPLNFPVFYVQCSPNEFNEKQLCKAQAMNFYILLIHDSGHCPMITHPNELLLLILKGILEVI